MGGPAATDAIEVRVAIRGGPFPGAVPATVRRRAEKMLQHLGRRSVELSIALVSDGVIRQLNQRYRGVDRPTDVLAFAMGEGEALAAPAGAPEMLGDVVISVDTARRQAHEGGRSLLAELSVLLAHGLLHLLGHQHDTAEQHRRMARLTAELAAAARRR